MVIDFQQHYTPPELIKDDATASRCGWMRTAIPNYLLNPLLADLPAHVRMMDRAGIDAGVLSCGSGFDQPDLAVCRLINDRIRQAVDDHPGRFIGLAHVPALKPGEAAPELKRCAVDLGFPGVVIASELQGQALDAESLRPFWRAASDLGLYVFIHPLPQVIDWAHMYADDLGRMLGWQFSLMVAAVRMINSGLLDELPDVAGPVLPLRGRHRPLSRTHPGISAARQMGHRRGPAPRPAAQAVRSIITSSSACSTIAPAGPDPTMRPNGAPNGCGSACRRWRCRRRCSRPTIRRRCAMPTRSPATWRRCARSAPMPAPWSTASRRSGSFPICRSVSASARAR